MVFQLVTYTKTITAGIESITRRTLRQVKRLLRLLLPTAKIFNLGAIHVDGKIAQLYQNASTDSREFLLRLLQMAAIVCHDIAGYLYTEYDGGIRKSPPDFDPQVPVPKPPPGITLPPLPKMPRRPAEFFHMFYMDWEHYPCGAADVVGYWAEYRLFGGVVLFDRGMSKTEFKDVYIQPIGRHHIFKLSETQIQNCVSILLSESTLDQDTSKAFRFRAEKYTVRIDPYEPSMSHVSRDQDFPREVPVLDRPSCVRRAENDPYLMDAMKAWAEGSGSEHGR
ncbi:hypothetical protein QBC33DRAFT_313530 [Phialemonium atrogriseum]|uniref:Uncharacterized protein n=1 Tax=Phialemonium atrogriseum TaxID=1093897 RepID=A0AAJ0C4V1_9PEZI|nr:uncharacterized protein QBC33DRAFT_313530 [Phialemonium atrogriseum]KAK1770183.1 hypothetical protein QBC33DRAFT_313530 [Phialemonium atrogriseum]